MSTLVAAGIAALTSSELIGKTARSVGLQDRWRDVGSVHVFASAS